MEPLSQAALGVLRDKTIADYLREHCCGSTMFSKQDHGQNLFDYVAQQFKLAGLPVPETYMKSVDNVCDRVKKFMADKKGDFKKEVDANCELVRYVLALRGIDTKKACSPRSPRQPPPLRRLLPTHRRLLRLPAVRAMTGPACSLITTTATSRRVYL